MSQSPEITGYRNHDNFISEYQSNLDGDKFVDFYELVLNTLSAYIGECTFEYA